VHGRLLMKDGKMSKSIANLIYPDQIVERYCLNSLRYYLLRKVPFGSDAVFTPDSFIDRSNFDLANDLDNLVNRMIFMINEYFDGEVPAYTGAHTDVDKSLEAAVKDSIAEYEDAMEDMKFSYALRAVWTIIGRS